jgi:hypothetical protein
MIDGVPIKIKTGKVMSVPPPAIALITPAAAAEIVSAKISVQVMSCANVAKVALETIPNPLADS